MQKYVEPALTHRQIHSLAYEKAKSKQRTVTVQPRTQISKKKGKQSQSQGPGRFIPQADMYHTLNYMYQRAMMWYLEGLRQQREDMKRAAVSCMLQFFSLARRSVIRVDPSIKRSVCSKCYVPQLEGLTCSTTLHTGRSFTLVRQTCTKCGACRIMQVSNQAEPSPIPTQPIKAPRKPKHLSQRQRRRRWMYSQHHPPSSYPVTKGPERIVPPYADRVDGTPWKEALLSHVSSSEDIYEKAVDMLNIRGGHAVTIGIGRNGQVNLDDF